MLLYWSMDQYNNVQKCVERKVGAMLPDGRKGQILRQFLFIIGLKKEKSEGK